MAERIAEKYGYRNMGQVSRLLHQKLPLVCVSLFSCFLSTLKRGTRHGGNDSFTSRQIIRGQRAEVQTRAMNLLWDSLPQECFVRQFSQRRRGKSELQGTNKDDQEQDGTTGASSLITFSLQPHGAHSNSLFSCSWSFLTHK